MSSLDPSRRMTEVITVKRQNGHTSAGDPTWAAAFTCAARIERGAIDQADAEGRKAVKPIRFFTTTELKIGDQVWLPESSTADSNAAQRVLTAVIHRALDGSVVFCTSGT
jgi:hypothetical protein